MCAQGCAWVQGCGICALIVMCAQGSGIGCLRQ
jgi:hypothetical protein